MKKLLVILFLCCIPWGCSKKGGLVEPPPIVPVKCTVEIVGINATVVPSGKFTVVQGTDVAFSGASPNGLVSVTINESKSSVTGTSYSSSLSASSNLKIVITGKELVIVPTRTDTLCSSKKWFIKSLDVWEDNKWKEDFILPDERKKEYSIFYPNEKLEGFRADGTSKGFIIWKWVGVNGFILGDQSYTYLLTDKEFALFYEKEGKKFRNIYWCP